MRALVAAGALLVGIACGPTERERCYDAAEAAAQRRVDRECPGAFDSCPTAGEILEELRLVQETCP